MMEENLPSSGCGSLIVAGAGYWLFFFKQKPSLLPLSSPIQLLLALIQNLVLTDKLVSYYILSSNAALNTTI